MGGADAEQPLLALHHVHKAHRHPDDQRRAQPGGFNQVGNGQQLRGLQDATRSLEATLASVDGKGDFLARATRYCEEVLPIMGEVRRYADLLETRVADDLWDLPSYQEILFGK